ncbi:MAG: hypothetical protein RLZZ575_632 [Actinomycetota bacterium]|jgi:predicted transcriptional regulator
MVKNFITFDELLKLRPIDEKKMKKHAKKMIAISRGFSLAEIRKSMKLTQVQVAKKIGVDQSNVSRIESGKFSSTEIGTLQAYVEALGGELEIYAKINKKIIKLTDNRI